MEVSEGLQFCPKGDLADPHDGLLKWMLCYSARRADDSRTMVVSAYFPLSSCRRCSILLFLFFPLFSFAFILMID